MPKPIPSLLLVICAKYAWKTISEGVQMEEERKLRTAVQAQLESLAIAKARKAADRQVGLKK